MTVDPRYSNTRAWVDSLLHRSNAASPKLDPTMAKLAGIPIVIRWEDRRVTRRKRGVETPGSATGLHTFIPDIDNREGAA